MADFTEVTSQGWFSRITESIKGVLFGLVLFVIAFPLLWWNEGRAVQDYKTLQEGASNTVETTPDKVDPAQDGKLVHCVGKADTKEVLTDDTFNVSHNALKLKRIVEMYQWEEEVETRTRKKVGGSKETIKEYDYRKKWLSRHAPSSEFKKPQGHENPSSMPWNDVTKTADKVTLGAYELPGSMVSRIGGASKITIDSNTISELPAKFRPVVKKHDSTLYLPMPPRKKVDPTNPVIGDVRIRWEVVEPKTVSVVAVQKNGTFEPYTAETGKTISLIQVGQHSAKEMYASEQAKSTMMTWLLRGGGFLAMFFGVMLVFRPLTVVADVVPLFGSILQVGSALVALVVALPLSLLTIAIAWLRFRPLLGIGLIVVGAAVTVGVFMWRKGKSPQPQPQAMSTDTGNE
jgi:hypothetical protein